ncbi:hypothetical protein PTKIN_Ptkin03bG0115700 [Pterospermum kingtungense]
MQSDVDGDGNGCIILEMLMSQLVGLACDKPTCEPELRETFDILDTDHERNFTMKEKELMAFYMEKIRDELCTIKDCRSHEVALQQKRSIGLNLGALEWIWSKESIAFKVWSRSQFKLA